MGNDKVRRTVLCRTIPSAEWVLKLARSAWLEYELCISQIDYLGTNSSPTQEMAGWWSVHDLEAA